MAKAIEQRLSDLYRKLGSVTPPDSITQQPLYETDQKHLERLAALNPGETANVWDLANYVDDLLYREIQTPLLVHALPSCLRSWHEYLRNEMFECPGFAQSFCTVLVREDTFAGILTDEQRRAVWEFMGDSILEEIDAQDCLRFEGYRNFNGEDVARCFKAHPFQSPFHDYNFATGLRHLSLAAYCTSCLLALLHQNHNLLVAFNSDMRLI